MQPKYLALVLLFASSLAWGQGACIPGQALTSRLGFSNLAAVVPQAQVQVSPGPIYTDQTDVTQAANPITADNVGNYSICAASGTTQTVTVTGANMNTLVYKLTFPATTIQGAGTAANNTFNGTNSFNSATTFNGVVVFNNTVGINTVMTTYAGNTLVGQGFPTEIGTLDLVAQSAVLNNTLLCQPPITGWYRITAELQITQVATTSSQLGGSILAYNNGINNSGQTLVMPLLNSAGVISLNTTANTTGSGGLLYGSATIYANTNFNSSITVNIGYTSVGATPMQYGARFRCELL